MSEQLFKHATPRYNYDRPLREAYQICSEGLLMFEQLFTFVFIFQMVQCRLCFYPMLTMNCSL